LKKENTRLSATGQSAKMIHISVYPVSVIRELKNNDPPKAARDSGDYSAATCSFSSSNQFRTMLIFERGAGGVASLAVV